MNDNDKANQLRLQYHMMRFSQNNKWWWALWLGGFEVCVVNAWMMYQWYHKDHDLEMVYNHYDFVKAASKAYLTSGQHNIAFI